MKRNFTLLLALMIAPLVTLAQTTEAKFVAQLYYTEAEQPAPKIIVTLKFCNNTGSVRELAQARWALFYNPDVLELIPAETQSTLYNSATDLNSGLNDPGYLVNYEHNQWVSFYDQTPDYDNPVYTGVMQVPKGASFVSKNFVVLEYQRSTSLCDNLFPVNGNDARLIYKVSFKLKDAVDPDQYRLREKGSGFGTPEYILEYIDQTAINTWPTPTSDFREIVFVKYDDLDQLRPRKHTSNCTPGSVITNATIITMGRNDFLVVDPSIVLAVKYIDLDVALTDDRIKITWQTSMESECQGFEVQKATGNGAFSTIGYCETQAINGNSAQPLTYVFYDNSPLNGTVFYRIKEISRGGLTSYSIVRSIAGKGHLSLKVYPNPSESNTNVVIPADAGKWQLALYDATGKLLRTWVGENGRTVMVEGLQTGFYYVRLTGETKDMNATVKLLVKY